MREISLSPTHTATTKASENRIQKRLGGNNHVPKNIAGAVRLPCFGSGNQKPHYVDGTLATQKKAFLHRRSWESATGLEATKSPISTFPTTPKPRPTRGAFITSPPQRNKVSHRLQLDAAGGRHDSLWTGPDTWAFKAFDLFLYFPTFTIYDLTEFGQPLPG